MGQIVTRAELPRLLDETRHSGRRIVFTNGVFDLLHVGHLRYLRAARALGDLLIVGLNDDASTTRLKGPARPLVSQDERAELLAALAPVDYVVLFGEDTAAALVAVIQPDVYVKGGDYAAAPGAAGKPLPEAALVHDYGGAVQVIPLEAGRSTTGLVERIVDRYSSG